MNLSLSAGALLALTAFATPISAQEPTKASTSKLLTPEASLNLRSSPNMAPSRAPPTMSGSTASRTSRKRLLDS